MKEIINEAKKIAGTMELDLYATDEELMKMDQEYYFEKGIEEGILQNKKQMVINLYNNKVPIEIIAKSANLSSSEVEAIVSEDNN